MKATSSQFGVTENKAALLLSNTAVEECKKCRSSANLKYSLICYPSLLFYLLSKSPEKQFLEPSNSLCFLQFWINLEYNNLVFCLSSKVLLVTRLEVEHYYIPCNSLLLYFFPDPFLALGLQQPLNMLHNPVKKFLQLVFFPMVI